MQQQQQADDGFNAGSLAATGATGTASNKSQVNGGRFDFDDGGTYCGGWEEGKAHGHGVCTGPKGQGAYSGSWHYGFEVSGVYTWPSGSCFEGQWQNGKRHGLGVETRGRWIYRGEWTQGFKGRYGVRQSNISLAKYEGTWANGLQDGYGSETYADEGTYQGQWMRGMRHGYGVRTSAPFGKASKYRLNKNLRSSLTSLRSNEATANESETTDKRDNRVDDSRGGFVLQSKSSEHMLNSRRRSLDLKKNIFKGILKKGASTGELDKRTSSGSLKSTASSASYISTDSAGSAMTNNSMPSDSNASFVIDDEQLDPNVTETYMGEWKNDKRSGYGISERSDGLKYEGEWYANKKYGYGVTTFSNAEKEEGKYKNNVLITSQKKKLFLMRSTKFRERIDAAVNAAQRASKIALQKADIAISRTATARGKAEQADLAAAQARDDSEVAESVAKKYAPDFKQTITSLRMRQKFRERMSKNLESTTNDKLPNTNLGLQPGNKMSNQIPNQINIQHRDQIGNHVPHMLNNLKANDASNDMQVNNNMYADKPIQNATPMQPVGKQHNPFQQHQPYQDNKALQQNHSNTSNPSFNHVGLPTNEHNPNEIKSHLPRNNVQTMTDREHNPVGGSNPRNSITAEQSLHRNSLAGLSRRQSGERPYLANIGHQMSIDHFDHYKRPPSRDSSVDRYTRATGKLSNSISSRQPSVDRTSTSRLETPEKNDPAYRLKSASPEPINTTDAQNQNNRNNWPPFEDVIIRKRGLGQDIVPSLNNPKRTESLHIPNQPKPPPIKTIVNQQSLQRKKSLPDVQELPRATTQIPREEVAALGSARREEIRRQLNEKERLRANPLLYLVSPQVKDWISRQQLVLVVLFVNISLAILFFKLLT